MHEPKQDKNANTKTDRQQTAVKSVSQNGEGIAASPLDPLVQQVSRMGNVPNPSAHAAILNRAPANQQSSNRQLLLQLQQQYGNPYVNQVLQLARGMGEETPANTTKKPLMQAKLTIGSVGDKYEQEADRTAQQVVQRMNAPSQSDGGQAIQGETMPEAELQKKPEISTIQRQEMPEEKEKEQQAEVKQETASLQLQKKCRGCDKKEEGNLAQMKPETGTFPQEEIPKDEEKELTMQPLVQRQPAGGGMAVTTELEASIQQAQGKGEPLAENIRQPMEQEFGSDFSSVRIHADAKADEMNQSLQARAFTVGQDIFFRQGAYDPNSKQGQELLAHELTHVIQQNGSEVQPTSDQEMMITKSPQNTGVQRLCSQCEQKKEKGVIQAKEVPGGTPDATVKEEPTNSPGSGQVHPKDSDSKAAQQPTQSDSSQCPPPPPDSDGEKENKNKDCVEKPSACSTGNISSAPEEGADGEVQSQSSSNIPKPQPRQKAVSRDNGSQLHPQGRGKVVRYKTKPQKAKATTLAPEAPATHLDLETQAEAANRGILAQKAEATEQALKAQVQLYATNAETARLTSIGITFALPQQKTTVAGEDNAVLQQQQRAIATSMASSFLAQGALQVQKVTALGQEILTQIQEASKSSIASVRGTIEQQKAGAATQMTGQRDQAQTDAQATIAHIHTRSQVAKAAVPQKTIIGRQHIETEYAKALFTIDERQGKQLDDINESYVEVCGQFQNVGQTIGDEALALGEQRAKEWESQKIHREDNFWDGYLTDKRLEARADAARKVAKQYKCELINEANAQADEIQKQKSKDIQTAHTIAEQYRQQAQILQQHSLENLSVVEEQALSQVAEAQIQLTETAKQTLQSTLQSLNQQETVQLQLLEGYGKRQILAIERDAQNAIASLQNGVNQVATSLQNALENSIAQFQGLEAPKPEELSVTLAEILRHFDSAIAMVQGQTQKGIATSKKGITQAGKQAIGAVTGIAESGIKESATVVEETKTTLAHLKKGATHTFNEIRRAYTKRFTEATQTVVKGFSQITEGIETTFKQNFDRSRFQQSVNDLEEGLRGSIHGYTQQSEECAIKYAADKAADQVQPRWKEVLKWFVIIFIAVVTIVVTIFFAPAGALLAVAFGVLVGVVSSIITTIITNAIDGKKWSDDIGYAALAGAIGGVLGGIGGALGQFVKIGMKAGKEVLKKSLEFAARFGINQVFNALGSLFGDLAVTAMKGEPIDWKAIGENIGIGAAMGVGGHFVGSGVNRKLAGIAKRAKVAEFAKKHQSEIGKLDNLDPKNKETFDEGVNKVAEQTGVDPKFIAQLAKLKPDQLKKRVEHATRLTEKLDKSGFGRFIKQRAITIADMHQQPLREENAMGNKAPETTTLSETSDRNTSTVSRPDADVTGVKRPETEEKAPETTISSTKGNIEAAAYQVFLKTLDGKTKILRITAETKISELKKDLGYESIDGYLISEGKVLQDELTIADYPNIQELSTIEFRARLRGGMEVFRLINSEQKQKLETHTQKPKLTSNMRDALKLAKEESEKHEAEDRAKVEERLRTEVGIDLTKHPDAYDLIVEQVKKAPVTINFKTIDLENFLKAGYYLNQWERSVHPNSGKKAYYGDSDYAVKRNEAEKSLHNLPEMEIIGEAAQSLKQGLLKQGIINNQTGEKSSLPIDKPHSAAVNVVGHRAGGAVNALYGTSHLILNENIKERSTLTGGDSLEAIHKKNLAQEAVGTFQNLGSVLLRLDPLTLKTLANQALNPKAPRNTIKFGNTNLDTSLPYVEAQVFGEINLSRDVSKIVIDEDDLNAWEKGELSNPYEHGKKLGKRKKSDIKQMLEDYAQKHGIVVQYIRTGKSLKEANPGAIRGAGEHISAFKQPWDTKVEETLNFFKNEDWQAGMKALHSLDRNWSESIINKSNFSEIGLEKVSQVIKQVENLHQNKDNFDQYYHKVMVKQLADNLLMHYFANGVDLKHIDIIKQVLVKATFYLGNVASQILSKANVDTGISSSSQSEASANATGEKAPEITTLSETSDRDTSTVSRPDTDVTGVKRPETEEKAPETTTSSGRSTHFDQPEIEPGVVAKEKTADGHEIKILRDGRIVHCSICGELRKLYAKELNKYSDFKQRLDEIEKISNSNEKREAAEAWKQDLLRHTQEQEDFGTYHQRRKGEIDEIERELSDFEMSDSEITQKKSKMPIVRVRDQRDLMKISKKSGLKEVGVRIVGSQESHVYRYKKTGDFVQNVKIENIKHKEAHDHDLEERKGEAAAEYAKLIENLTTDDKTETDIAKKLQQWRRGEPVELTATEAKLILILGGAEYSRDKVSLLQINHMLHLIAKGEKSFGYFLGKNGKFAGTPTGGADLLRTIGGQTTVQKKEMTKPKKGPQGYQGQKNLNEAALIAKQVIMEGRQEAINTGYESDQDIKSLKRRGDKLADDGEKNKIKRDEGGSQSETKPSKVLKNGRKKQKIDGDTALDIEAGNKQPENITQLRQQMESLYENKTLGDGNCFYHAVYETLNNQRSRSTETQQEVRDEIVNQLLERNLYGNDETAINTELDRLQTGQWAENNHISLAAETLNLEIVIWDRNGNWYYTASPTHHNAQIERIHLIYTGDHYNSLTPNSL